MDQTGGRCCGGPDDIVSAVDLSERGASARRHPWEVVRGEFFASLVAEFAPSARRVIDVGAGDSWFGSYLAGRGDHDEIVCWDTAYTVEDLQSAPAGVTRSAVGPPGEFDLVLLMDVLEHIADVGHFLDQEVRPRLAPGAVVVASVPAHPRLFSSHDTALGHHRRYRPAEFLREVGSLCPVVEDGPLFVSLTVPRAAQVVAERLRPAGRAAGDGSAVGNWSRGSLVTGAVHGALALDARLCRWLGARSVPLRGLSHWAVAVDQRMT